MNDAVKAEVEKAARPAAHWIRVAIDRLDESRYRVGGIELQSRDLWKTLDGCREAFLFCATLGADVDALIRRYAYKSAADLYDAQIAALMMIEQYCDECEVRMGGRHRMRYSPGYGDLPLTVQRPLLDALDAQRRIGVTLTQSQLMAPSKSVSAIIGIEP